MSDRTERIRMLYFVGAGPMAKDRVDIAHLFGDLLGRDALAIDWYLRSARRGGPVAAESFHGQPARVCGRSSLPGAAGRIVSRIQEVLATLHFFITALTGRYELIQVRDDFLAAPLGLLAARWRRCPFVFWLSYPFPEARRLDAQEGRARWPLYARWSGWSAGAVLYRLVLPYADHIFVQSEQMKRDLLRPGVDPRRLTAVPMGLPDQDLPAPGPQTVEPLVLYLGTLARVRRLTMIVEAFAQVHARLPEARLVLVGEGDQPADRADLEQAVQRHGLGDAVEFTGQLPREAALAWVRRAAVCLSPFYPTFVLRSTSPTKLIEYMAMGKAVIANDHPEQAAIVKASGAGLCTAWDPAAFADAIETLLNDPARRETAGRAGRDWVIGHRLYSRLASELLGAYRRLAAEGMTAPAGRR